LANATAALVCTEQPAAVLFRQSFSGVLPDTRHSSSSLLFQIRSPRQGGLARGAGQNDEKDVWPNGTGPSVQIAGFHQAK
jgi:hypothetical protein